MKLFFLFLATSALFTAAAIPMISFGSASAPSASEPPDPNQAPKIAFGSRMSKNDKTAAKDLIIGHHIGLEPWNNQKQAKLAFAQNGWVDGIRHDDQHRQYLSFNYHRGDTPDSGRIGRTETVVRDRPLPEAHFSHGVLSESKPEIIKEMNKKYEALPPDMAGNVRSMKVQGDWASGQKLREQTQMTFHQGTVPAAQNIIGNPVTIYRPMSFRIDGAVPKDHIPTIKKRIREEHEKLDANHPLKQANFGVVTRGWQVDKRTQRVGATLYKVKDELPNSAEEDFEKIGNFGVTLGRGRRPTAMGLSRSTRRKLKAQDSVPDVSAQEAPGPNLGLSLS